MKWKEKPETEIGEKRTVKRFLLRPRLIDGEWRWLESAAIEQEYVTDGDPHAGAYWSDVRFVDEE